MDLGILQWINNNLHGSAFVNQLFKYISYLGEKGIVWIALALVLLCFKKTRKGGFLLLVSLGIGIVLNNLVIKPVVARPRPFAEDTSFVAFIESIGMKLPDSFSMPSGHTQIAINAAMFLTLCFKGKGAWAWIPAMLISTSRIFLCVHYPTDILVAALVGIIVAVLIWWIGQRILDKIIAAWQAKRNKSKQEQSQNHEEIKTE